MKVLHVITSLRTGGAEHLMLDLLPRLRAYGHDVELLLFDGTRTPFYEQLERQDIRIHSLGTGMKSMHNPLHLFWLWKYLRRYDIIHTHNTPCQLLAAIASIFIHCTLVTTEHNTSNRRRAWKWYRAIDRWMYGRYRRIICVNKEVEALLSSSLDSQRLSGRMVTINNGIDVKKFAAAKGNEALRRQYPGCKLVVMVAAFRPQKDQQSLITAMQPLPDSYHLLLAGDGKCKEGCEKMVRDLRLEDRIHFLGIRTDIPSLLKTADAVVMSSHYEGLSLSSIEGLASGTPVIASDVDGLRDIIGGAGLLFPEGGSAELAESIRKVCEDKGFSDTLSKRCLQRAMRYDIANMVEGYDRVYRSYHSK